AFNATNAKGLSKDDRKKAEEHFKAVKAEKISAEQVAAKAAKGLAKASEKSQSSAEKIAATKAHLDKLRNAGKPTVSSKKSAGKDDVRKAAKEAGVDPVKESSKPKVLNYAEAKDAIKTLIILGAGQRTKMVGTEILECFAGKIP